MPKKQVRTEAIRLKEEAVKVESLEERQWRLLTQAPESAAERQFQIKLRQRLFLGS